ncbi:hypothetical protein HN992_02975 [Candidatus Woesearchaeota archaeon]|jgi:NMD protein affecting ribosome stability and mRNA decay|nr:hypothetical protein [Candidatus Woesearchaeota archaeon]MBT3438750.1 hypothetical protein [Candidatus Woesearchaeota archaeon]MBT4058447.1 hypothetical protein [Candidatus Woesearchaeota archaeon]MBT4208764.1 hypothetical protein [Candidatus Woesearchaeota archaeon]MBT4733147.1 hypothetical protein [Candidatus Woesearchaeota archaeon]
MPNTTPSNDALKYKYKPPGDKHENYWEAKLQLRPYDEEMIKFVINQIDNNDRVRIMKVLELKTGIDLYLSSRKFAAILGKTLKKKYKDGKILVTKSLFSRNKQTSKNIYRVTVLFRLN